MRLVLRNLLSYLDNVLSEEDREKLQAQIESSEHASEWIYRTRDVMRRLKLGAPELEGTGSVDDPNTVAEYLDRALSEVNVTEFERVCLESDTMLAEVASCHHVLAMVLNEPSEIDPDTRRRLHGLRDQLKRASQQAAAPPPEPELEVEPPEEAAAAVGRPVKPPAGIDRRDDETRTRLLDWAPAIAALLLLAVTATLALRPAPGKVADTDPEQQEETLERDPDSPGGGDIGDPPNDDTTIDDSTDNAIGSKEAIAGEDARGELDDDGQSGDPSPTIPPVPDPDPEPQPQPPVETDSTADEPSPDPTPSIVDTPPEPTPDPEKTPPPSPPAKPATVTYVSPPPSFAVAETMEGDGWLRLVTGLEAGGPVRLKSLPTYRAAFMLTNGLGVELVGSTDVIVTPEQASLEIGYGRFVLSNPAAEGKPVAAVVLIDGQLCLFELSPGAKVAIATDRFAEPGQPLRGVTQPAVTVVKVMAGEAKWAGGGGNGTANGSEKPTMIDPFRTQALATKAFKESGWVQELPLTPPDMEATAVVASMIPPGTPEKVWPMLVGIESDSRFWEVKSLAARCSLALGHPESVVGSFKDPEQRVVWALNLQELREAAARNAEFAEQIYQEFVRQHGADGAAPLFRLLKGFSPEQIGSSAAEVSRNPTVLQLVEGMGDSDLATRVLSYLVLDEVTRLPDSTFNPAGSTKSRRDYLRGLKRLVENDRLEPRAKPRSAGRLGVYR